MVLLSREHVNICLLYKHIYFVDDWFHFLHFFTFFNDTSDWHEWHVWTMDMYKYSPFALFARYFYRMSFVSVHIPLLYIWKWV